MQVEHKSNLISVEIIKDSYNPEFSSRITTMILEYPRIVHSELMTHRCLVGGTKLIFDLPSGQANSKFRKYEMTIEDFYKKWHFGGKERKPSRAIAWDFSAISLDKVYTAKDLATIIGMSSPSNIRQACREGKVVVQNPNKNKSDDYLILGSDFIKYKVPVSFSQNIRKRLDSMNIRMLDTNSGEVKHTNITDIWLVGEKETYTLTAGKYNITGTYDHPVLTDSGWKNLSDITKEDSVVIISNKQKHTKDPKAMKYVDGKWRSTWQKNMLKKLNADQCGVCSCCEKEDKLEIHHVKPVYSNPELTFDESNVIAICNSCHKVAHEKQGWQEGNPLSASHMKVSSVVKTGKVEKVYDLSVADENHNFVANGIVVHNCFSRNASSSRAIPVSKVIGQVQTNPAMPVRFGKNQAGMVDAGECNNAEDIAKVWKASAKKASTFASMMNRMGVHKQVANRILEPYQFIRVCITSTNWNNWFNLRNHPDADPTIHALAETMEKAMEESEPKRLVQNEWHIPFVNEQSTVYGQEFYDDNWNKITLEQSLMISASCAAQTSYRKLDNSLEKAEDIYKKLIESKPCHASPVEHQAMVIAKMQNPMDYFNIKGVTHIDRNGIPWSGNLHGVVQYRQLITGNAEYY